MTQFNRLKFSLVVSAFLAVAGLATMPALAQPANMQEMFEKADANGDGDIAWSEIEALRLESFERADRNGDGIINTGDRPPRAFAGRFDQALERLQSDFDGDRDGQITEEEMLNAPAPMFEQGDVNGDKLLTAEEMAAIRSERAPL